jgi:hypothetical protein
MAVPWIRILDTALGLADLARRATRPAAVLREAAETLAPARAATEARLAGVVVAALKEAFDRDHQRLELEREQRDAERRRAERMLKIEVARQAGDREVGRLRWLAAASIAGWIGSLYLMIALATSAMNVRATIGVGSLLLLIALASALTAQTSIGAELARLADGRSEPETPTSGTAGAASAWFLVSGLGVIAVGVILH